MAQHGAGFDASGGGAWERGVPVSLRAGDKDEAVQELTLRIALAPGKHTHAGRVRVRVRVC